MPMMPAGISRIDPLHQIPRRGTGNLHQAESTLRLDKDRNRRCSPAAFMLLLPDVPPRYLRACELEFDWTAALHHESCRAKRDS